VWTPTGGSGGWPRTPATGVFVRPAVFYFRRLVEDNPIEHRKMRELQDRVRGFRRDRALAEENGVSAAAAVRDAYTYLAPMIDTDTYLAWLLDQAVSAGCVIVRARIEGDLVEGRAVPVARVQAMRDGRAVPALAEQATDPAAGLRRAAPAPLAWGGGPGHSAVRVGTGREGRR